MQSRINGHKNASYLGFLQAIGEENLPSFSERQEKFIKYVSEMLPIVRPYEYLIVQALVFGAGECSMEELHRHVQINAPNFNQAAFDHALFYMMTSGFFSLIDEKLSLLDLELGVELDEYLRDLLEYGLGKYDVDFHDAAADETFHLWAKYRKEQVQQLLLNNPGDIMVGTKIYDGIVYAYVTVIKGSSTAENLKYADGYIDADTFQWETVANVGDRELTDLKNSRGVHIFVRKVASEDGITLPFTYIGTGKMEYIEGSKKSNGAHLFRVPMETTAPEDIYFDFKLPE